MTDRRLRALIVDDESAARDVVSTLLRECPQVEVVGEAADGPAAVEQARQLRPDLIFLDVQMPGLDGLGVLDALGADAPRGVIFVTAHDEHAIEAFERHALDYLLKPFGRPRFDAAVKRAIERLDAIAALDLQRTMTTMRGSIRDTSAAGALTLTDPPQSPGRTRRIGVKTGTRTVIIEASDIDWIAADGDYIRIHCGKHSHLASHRMQALEEMLDPAQFLRVHRSVLVNVDRVRELHREPDGSGALVLRNGVSLRVARARWDVLERALGLS